jgi:hypothetical protein
MVQTEWKIAAVSVAGFAHQAKGEPCQDAHFVSVTDDHWLIAAVCDGAGSASRSGEGSVLLCRKVVNHLASAVPVIARAGDDSFSEIVRPEIEQSVMGFRRELHDLCDRDGCTFADFHSTLVGVIAGRTNGVFFHIGDGAGIATSSDDFSKSVISPPENGEYAIETFFATEEDWVDHLRLTPFGPEHDLIALMSDGVTPFALSPGGIGPYPPFFEPLSRFLVERPRGDGERALVELLNRDAIRSITGDDKTLIWARRGASDE